MSKREPRVIKDIDPKRYYTAQELFDEVHCFPWLMKPTYRGYLKTMKEELEGENILNVKEVQGVKKNRYLVKGSDILAYLEKKLTN